MTEISPAILTSEAQQLRHLLEKYVAAGFESVDIDIQETPFASRATLPWQTALEVVSEAAREDWDISIGWDLKMAVPEEVVKQLLNSRNVVHRIYVYQNAEIDFARSLLASGITLGVGIYPEVALQGIEYYKAFPEVQFMTITSEAQGSEMDLDTLSRVTEIREMGYTGTVSIDGGVNLKTAENVRLYSLDRVSVGSYFQESQDLALDRQKLALALNL
jgi:pentose-5-phosphate-3-epimerase